MQNVRGSKGTDWDARERKVPEKVPDSVHDMSSDWQPIETAPRDGTWILAYFNDRATKNEFTAVVKYTHPNGTGGQYGDFVWETPDSRCGYYAERVFTHWMPLPPPSSLGRAG